MAIPGTPQTFARHSNCCCDTGTGTGTDGCECSCCPEGFWTEYVIEVVGPLRDSSGLCPPGSCEVHIGTWTLKYRGIVSDTCLWTTDELAADVGACNVTTQLELYRMDCSPQSGTGTGAGLINFDIRAAGGAMWRNHGGENFCIDGGIAYCAGQEPPLDPPLLADCFCGIGYTPTITVTPAGEFIECPEEFSGTSAEGTSVP